LRFGGFPGRWAAKVMAAFALSGSLDELLASYEED
jgi:hypothetical protein